MLIQPGERFGKRVATNDVGAAGPHLAGLEFKFFFGVGNHIIVVFVDGNTLVGIDFHRNALQVGVEVLAQNFWQEQVHACRHLVTTGVDDSRAEEVQHLRCRQESVAIGQLAIPTAGHFLSDIAELEVGLGEACHVVGEIL